jgi:uncharacterized protein involved in exopolysaccharide biosynthesis
LAQQSERQYVEEGIDGIALLTPLIENWRRILLGAILIAGIVGGWAALRPRKFKAEMWLTPVTSTRTPQALGGLAALAGATIQQGYSLTPARMVEFLKSRAVLAGVGLSRLRPNAPERVIDRAMGKHFEPDDAESVARQISKLMDVTSNKETGTITLTVSHKDSALARLLATQIVDSASQYFVTTSKSQAQMLRIAQEARVASAAAALASAEESVRQFNYQNRSSPVYSQAGLEHDRLLRQTKFAEQVYTQAITDRDAAYARELEATPTVVVQDPLPAMLPKVRKHIIVKTIIAFVTGVIAICVAVLIGDVFKRRLARTDSESERFRNALAKVPRLGTRRQSAV